MANSKLERLDAIIIRIGELVEALHSIAEMLYHSMPEDEKCHCEHVEEFLND